MVVDLITNYPDILSFQNKMQNFTMGVMGVHNGGHYTIGGDSGMDVQLASRSILLLPSRHEPGLEKEV
ncbi:hypothetical protein ACET3X_009197 [Alternaria dauci]|uniref:Uncharacterized protein n=1 Tax=Alternaria dauci TaxID=48095 RepID=A0ABR3U848_9PLEO